MKWFYAFLIFGMSNVCEAQELRGIERTFNGVTDTQLEDIFSRLGNAGLVVQDGPLGTVGPEPIPTPQISLCPDGSPLPGETCTQTTPFDQAKERLANELDPRVIGGLPANIEEFPWQVVLIAGDTPSAIRSTFCGGSIIGYTWVLTAAHCLAGIEKPKDVDIVAGSTFPKYAGQGDRVNVSAIYVHQSYNATTFENDIALLKLQRAVRRGKRVSVAEEGMILAPGLLATVTGWGAVTAYGPMVDHLMRAKLPIIDNEQCRKAESYGDAIKEGMLCAGLREGGLDACQGDSGGPLVTEIGGRATLIGVVSWGRGCALRLKYGVYTRVSKYADWISQTMSSRQSAQR